MTIKLTRHAKNNMRLYKITTADIKEVIERPTSKESQEGKIVAISPIQNKFRKMPLKVVYTVEKDQVKIITAYPLKKAY